MPLVRSISATADGFVIVTSNQGTKTFTRALIPANVLSQPVATVEAWVNTWLSQNTTGMVALVHITQLTPTLIAQVICANSQPPSNWWQGVAHA